VALLAESVTSGADNRTLLTGDSVFGAETLRVDPSAAASKPAGRAVVGEDGFWFDVPQATVRADAHTIAPSKYILVIFKTLRFGKLRRTVAAGRER
jgi:hypothetical protein